MDNIKSINIPKLVNIDKTPQRIKQSLELKPDTFERSNVNFTGAERAEKLKTTKLYPDCHEGILGDKSLNFQKLTDKIQEIETKLGDNIQGIKFSPTPFESDKTYTLEVDLKDFGSKNELLDKDLNVLATEDVKLQFDEKGQKKYQIVKVDDKRTNTVSKIRYKADNKSKINDLILTHEIRIVKDKNGKTLKTEYTEPSDVKGIYNIKHVYPDGREEIVSSGKKDKDGSIKIKKNMTSLDGAKTDYNYTATADGSSSMSYKIFDASGNTILNKQREFNVIDENHFKSIEDGKSYDIKVSEKNIVVKDETKGKETKIVFDNFIKSNKKDMINLLTKIPGDELISLKKETKSLKGIKDVQKSEFISKTRQINVGDNLYTILHELGHAKDLKTDPDDSRFVENRFLNDKKIKEAFKSEKEAFCEAFPNAQRNHMNYFLNPLLHASREKGGLEEILAETNAILGTYNTEDDIAQRSQYLQQYYPKTIAAIAEKLV